MIDNAAKEFEQQRRRLMAIAYRMLGSFADAQDVVQDAFLRWHGTSRDAVESPRAFLSTVVTRLCLDRLRSAAYRREAYVGPWLPEPVLADLDEAPNEAVEQRIDAPVALMLALERLSPLERAVFILHDVMEGDLADVATAIERTPVTTRQLLARARAHVGEPVRRYPLAAEEGRRIAAAFFEASQSGSIDALRAILADAALLTADGGGKVLASRNRLEGADRISRFFAGIAAKTPPHFAWSGILGVNGLPGYVSRDGRGVLQTTSFAIAESRIVAIYVMRNPDKLRHLETLPLALATAARPDQGGLTPSFAG